MVTKFPLSKVISSYRFTVLLFLKILLSEKENWKTESETMKEEKKDLRSKSNKML